MLLQELPPWYLIDPTKSNWLGYWDLFNSVVLLYVALSAPFEVAFLEPAGSPLDARFILNRFIDLVFGAVQIAVVVHTRVGRPLLRWHRVRDSMTRAVET